MSELGCSSRRFPAGLVALSQGESTQKCSPRRRKCILPNLETHSRVESSELRLIGQRKVQRLEALECVSKVEDVQFRAYQAAFQGGFPKAYWLQVEEKQHRNAVLDAENACSGF